eukprot:11151067-Heterocapsa_arctica.AAC.1
MARARPTDQPAESTMVPTGQVEGEREECTRRAELWDRNTILWTREARALCVLYESEARGEFEG